MFFQLLLKCYNFHLWIASKSRLERPFLLFLYFYKFYENRAFLSFFIFFQFFIILKTAYNAV